MSTEAPKLDLREGYTEKYGFHDTEQSVFKSRRGSTARSSPRSRT